MKVPPIILLLAAIATAKPRNQLSQWTPLKTSIDLSQYEVRTTLKQSPNMNWLESMNTLIEYQEFLRNFQYVKGTEKQDADCGVENIPEDKIVGGQEANPHQFPWLVALFVHSNEGDWFCSASLISKDWVLTAAHCADGALSARVFIGAHNVDNPEPEALEIEATEFIVHEKWSFENLHNDLALIHLPEPAPLSDTVRTSCLPTFEGPEEPDFVEEKATVTGWGKPSDEANGKSPNLRYYKGVTVIDNTECKRYYGDTAWDGLVCIDTTGSHGVCNGDSGGPLNHETSPGKYEQIGIASFVSSGGCENEYPHGFTRVTHYLQWIATKTGIDLET